MALKLSFPLLVFSCAILFQINLGDPSADDINAAFTNSKIVPDVIDVAPQNILQVSYPSGKSVNLGDELNPADAKDQPTLSFPTEDGALYTLVMVDADIFPNEREWLHWQVVNIPSSCATNAGNTIQPYLQPGPPPGTGLHRYVFLAFKQAGEIALNDPNLPTTRKSFNTRNFAKVMGLGNAIAGNYFVAQDQS